MKCPTTPEEWRAISDKFAERGNFPHTCGALDGKHVNCKCPPNSGSLFYNYKGFYSVVLMALVEADYKLIWADIGGMGSASDAHIYNASELKECVEDGSLGFPDPEPLPNDNLDEPYFFRRRRCLCPTNRHDEAVQPPGYDATRAHLELPAFPSQEGRRKCLRHPCQ